MSNDNRKQMYAAIEAGDLKRVKELIGQDRGRLEMELPPFGALLHVAAGSGRLEIVKYLVSSGVDINRRAGMANASAVRKAASGGHLAVVKYLLDAGAHIDVSEPEINPLFGAIYNGHTAVARLLIERGIDASVRYTGENMREMDAVAFAKERGRTEIVELLIQSGCKDTGSTGRHATGERAHPILSHIQSHWGTPLPISLGQILPSDPPTRLHVVPRTDSLVLATAGMSDKALSVPRGQERFRYAELVMLLPADWPRGPDAKLPKHAWPYLWIQKIAAFPHEAETWLRSATLIDCGEPLAPNTPMSCLLAISADGDNDRAQLADGRSVVFYFLVPIYREERDFQKREGIDRLITLLRQSGFDRRVAMNRPNLAERKRG